MTKTQGTNSRGNAYKTPGGRNSNQSSSYHYSNRDGSYYYKNDNGSTYHAAADGSFAYKAPSSLRSGGKVHAQQSSAYVPRSYLINSRGNPYKTPGGRNTNASTSYHYSNTDGSYYYKNDNGSTYHAAANGSFAYKAPKAPRSGGRR